MMVFWMLLGASAGIKVMQSVWHLLGLGGGEKSIAVPVGGVVGALIGVLLGMIRNPKYLVLVMAAFAGSAAGGVAGGLPWGAVGEVGGQVAGGLVGAVAWAAWLFFGGGTKANLRTDADPASGGELAGHLKDPAKVNSPVGERASYESANRE
jgi:hypothetical protein